MNGIYFKDGIYFLIDDNTKNDIVIYHKDYKGNVSLYGGRICIDACSDDTAKLFVDGISIEKLDTTYRRMDQELELHIIISHLNAIEANGVV